MKRLKRRQQQDDRHIFWSDMLSWAFGSDELKSTRH